MITQKQLKDHFLGLKGAIYVWGANCVTITEDMINTLYKNYGSEKYNKAYYDGKLAEGRGKIGADCSGALYPVSGYDTTAGGYYTKCTDKGEIGFIPKDKVCLVFKVNSSGIINHVGCYTGDGYVSEMASSKKNYQRKPLARNGWDKWGLPDFVDYEEPKKEELPDQEPTVNEEKELLEVDGFWGKDTTTKTQVVFGTTVDGVISNQSYASKKYLPNCKESSWKFNSTRKGSEVIRAIQKFLILGYYTGTIDGLCGKQTVIAIQKFLKAIGLYSGSIDAKMGPGTVKGWQQYINNRL